MVKKVNMVLFSTVIELPVFFNCCKHPPVKCKSWSHYATLNQLEQEQSAKSATHNLCSSQLSGSVSCRRWRHFWKSA